MTVQELIDALNAIDDKDKEVGFYNEGDWGCVLNVYDAHGCVTLD